MSDAAMMRMNAIASIEEHWGWFLALGIIFIIGGILAIVMPLASSFAVALVVSVVLAWIGVMQIIQAFSVKSWGGFAWQLVVGLVILAGGIAAFVNPVAATAGLTVIVGAVFVAKGIFQTVLAFRIRPHSGWGWILTAGILAIIVGLIILLYWPVSTLWVLGTLAGISLIFSGWAYVMMAMVGRQTAMAA